MTPVCGGSERAPRTDGKAAAADVRIALIRGINVGRAKRVAMGDLRGLVEDLGYRDVRTLLNSGNVVLTVPPGVRGDPATRIQDAMAVRLDVHARVIALTAAELTTIMRRNPLLEVADDPTRLMAAVLADPSHRTRLQPLAKQDWTPEALAFGARVAYLWCPAGILDSRLTESVGRLLGDAVTSRNWATMTKLHALTVAAGRA